MEEVDGYNTQLNYTMTQEDIKVGIEFRSSLKE